MKRRVRGGGEGGNAYVRGSEDGAVPVRHTEVLRVLKAVGAGFCSRTFVSIGAPPKHPHGPTRVVSVRTCAEALLAFLQLLEESEVPGHPGSHFFGLRAHSG